MRKLLPVVIIALLLPTYTPVVSASSGRAINVDLDVTDISMSYPSQSNQTLYQMFSSNYPIPGFDKPEMLYVTDGVVNVEININIVITNLGTAQSGFVDIEVLVLHNEYTRFELLNTTVGTTPISGSSSSSVDVLWTPRYSGNHTLSISVSNTLGDDDSTNNQQNRHMTIAYYYDTCNDMSQWTSTGDWKVNSDVSISQSSAFHIGNGQYSTYTPSTTSTLTSPPFNVADDVSGNKAAIGYSFFYTGGAGSGDQMKGYVKDQTGNWDETFTMQNVVDNNFQDGLSWNTFSATYNNKNSPLIPLDNSHFHTTTQLQFTFTSDSIGNDIGYWMDELVIIYDQAAKKKEYSVQGSGVNTLGGLPGDWSTTRLQMTNTGNISARYTPTLTEMSENWSHYFAYPTGANIGSSGVELLPGESREFDLKVLIDENASQGSIPVTINVTSNQYSDIQSSIQSSIKILPDRMPDIIVPDIAPRCGPGSTCDFPVSVENIGEATDVFTLSLSDKVIPQGWTIDFAVNQSTNILVRVDSPAYVWLTAYVATDAEPDERAEVWFSASSTNDTRRTDMEIIEVAAAMISDAQISLEQTTIQQVLIEPGQSHDVSFRIWNNASRIDIFQPGINYTEITGWSVELLETPELAIAAGSSSSYSVRITAPANAQADDVGPVITPTAFSIRSQDLITGQAWSGTVVSSVYDVAVELLESPTLLSPGIATPIDLRVTNYGNGPVTAMIDLPWSSDTWGWWAFSDGVNVTDGIEMTVSYDLENVKMIELWLLLPPLESPAESHEITIQVNPLTGQDINPEDNSVLFEAITETTRQPKLDGIGAELVVETNYTYTFNATAWNIGNAADSTIRARLVIETNSNEQVIIGFLSTSTGLSKNSGEWINLNLGPTKSVELTADVIIPMDCKLNTIITATIELQGGSNGEGNPMTKSVASALMVAERRDVEIEELPNSQMTLGKGETQIVWVNLTSTSTAKEFFEISAELPENWGVICDGSPVHLSPLSIEIQEGHLNPQMHDIRCEIIREKGIYSGQFTIFVNGTDSRINHRINGEISWEREGIDDGLLSISTISGIGIGVLILAIGIFLLRNSDDEEDEEIIDKTEIGPPASVYSETQTISISGPPATQASLPSPMEEYNRQLEEYNRKMAEYQAWQDAQGSQVVLNSQDYE